MLSTSNSDTVEQDMYTCGLPIFCRLPLSVPGPYKFSWLSCPACTVPLTLCIWQGLAKTDSCWQLRKSVTMMSVRTAQHSTPRQVSGVNLFLCSVCHWICPIQIRSDQITAACCLFCCLCQRCIDKGLHQCICSAVQPCVRLYSTSVCDPK